MRYSIVFSFFCTTRLQICESGPTPPAHACAGNDRADFSGTRTALPLLRGGYIGTTKTAYMQKPKTHSDTPCNNKGVNKWKNRTWGPSKTKNNPSRPPAVLRALGIYLERKDAGVQGSKQWALLRIQRPPAGLHPLPKHEGSRIMRLE